MGKTTMVEEEINRLLGVYMATDYVALYDLHEHLVKEHTIKIEAPRGEDYLTIDEKSYCNW